MQPPATVLIVDTDTRFVSKLASIIESMGYHCISTTSFADARRHLDKNPPHAILTNLRLEAFNGLHLAYVAASLMPDGLVVVYAKPHDPMLAREAQAAGAFYERQEFVLRAVPSLLRARLPPKDRRQPETIDRRALFRGGRRSTDVGLFGPT